MSPRTGRPPKQKNNPRNIALTIRLTEDEKNEIKECAEEHNLCMTDAILKAIRLLKNNNQKEI